MKRNTLILLLVAAALVVAVYFLEIRNPKPLGEEDTEKKSKPAFTFKREDIAAITITRPSENVTLETHDGKWVISQPLNAPADETAADSLARAVADSKIERTITASDEDKKTYGLTEPAVTLQVKLTSGEEHTIRLGVKDFSGLSAYAQFDQQNDVALVGSTLLTSADKSIDDLRDRSVIGVSQFDIRGLILNNEHGKLTLTKESGEWKVKTPFEGDADESEINSLVSEITAAKAEEFVADANPDLKKYGLEGAKISLTLQLQGNERVLTVGSEVDGSHYAKTSERSQVFKIDSALYDKLTIKPATLRSKDIIQVKQDEVTEIQITNPNCKVVAEKKEDKWVVKEPADKKDKDFSSWKVFSPLETKASDVLDAAPAAARAKLAKPAVTIQLTTRDGKTTTVKVSSADGDDAYVTVDGKSGVFKVGKSVLEQLSFKIADAVT
jgi:hypothetical protein